MTTSSMSPVHNLSRCGYDCESFSITNAEHQIIFDIINNMWINRIKAVDPDYFINNPDSDRISRYHHTSISSMHNQLWPKNNRIFCNDDFLKVKDMAFMKKLSEVFGNFYISDESDLGFGNMYWRLVRPFEDSDVGPIHADSWYWQCNDQYGYSPSSFSKRLKVWIPISTEVGKNGLLVEDGSHLRTDIIWQPKYTNNEYKPFIQSHHLPLNLHLLDLDVGSVLLFDDLLLHGGSPNIGTSCRISLEFTLLFP